MQNRWIALTIGGLVMTAPAFTPATRAENGSLTQFFPALVDIQLTPAQQGQLRQMSQQTLPQVQQLLSPAQLTQFNTVLTQGQSVRAALFSLDLSMSQQLKLRRILESVRSQFTHILTLEQQQQLMQNARSLQQSRE